MSLTSEWNQYFKIEEKHLTASAIKRLKIAVIVAIPIIPIAAGLDLASAGFPMLWDLIAIIADVSCFIAMLYVFLNPISNTLMQKDEKLDEWGVAHKLAAQSFSFRITSGLIFVLWGLALVSSYIPQMPKINFNVSIYEIGSLILSVWFFLWLTSTAHIAWTIQPIAPEGGRSLLDDKAVMTAREQKVEAAIILVVGILMGLAVLAGLFALGWMRAHNAAGH